MSIKELTQLFNDNARSGSVSLGLLMDFDDFHRGVQQAFEAIGIKEPIGIAKPESFVFTQQGVEDAIKHMDDLLIFETKARKETK